MLHGGQSPPGRARSGGGEGVAHTGGRCSPGSPEGCAAITPSPKQSLPTLGRPCKRRVSSSAGVWSVQLWGGGLLHFNASAISCPPGKCWACVFNTQHARICTNRNLHQRTCVRNLILKSKISSRSNEDCTACCLYPFPLPKLGNFTENQWHSQKKPHKPSRIA